ncbi:SigE family RNA polymerase sigma factor [Cryptosporangium aurantiacum]|uniref:RNA polymerase sigma-70 factor, ECF subfamily n=1 Tax=Cryptosporangium aurantiacum TaxID=134849 RepID=A0A1M7RBH5_9ACTN|nr:SigE family RNA polymerase sigma factor [Cryptosporangium aurantiacum]SHN43551.1 RNA polymerase sigma-70 factor, ECF subfamily [Cryptosporangium aurantiacum]
MEEQFDAFYAAHFRPISVQLYAYFGAAADANDLTQEAFCRAWERWDQVRAYDDPAGWVRRVAWRLAVSRWRRARTALAHRAALAAPPTGQDGGETVDLVRALAALPPDQRRAVVLRHVADLSVAEIAADAGVPEGTVKSWLSRGRVTLRRALAETTALTTEG